MVFLYSGIYACVYNVIVAALLYAVKQSALCMGDFKVFSLGFKGVLAPAPQLWNNPALKKSGVP